MKRRAFLHYALGAGALLPLASSGLFARAIDRGFLARRAVTTDNILVLINLNGGNDGLNTVVPIENDIYHKARPTLAIAKDDALRLTDEWGLHPAMREIRDLYRDGECAIVQNVGYPGQDRSHFRSSDIWHSASKVDETLFTGWTGRYLDTIHPEYPEKLPDAPFAIQISNSTTLLIQGRHGGMGMALDSPERFYDLAHGLAVENDPLPPYQAGVELAYIRQIMVEADLYSTEINRVISVGRNHVEYGTDPLSLQLKGVARLIDGGLATSVYVVTLSGFDTHFRQKEQHDTLIERLSRSVGSFLEDLVASGNSSRVVCMTYSEFGRRVAENGQAGTDHGAAAPLLVFGTPVLGGQIVGTAPDLQELDSRGDLKHAIDFRQVYATVLQDWLGFTPDETDEVLGGSFKTLPLFKTSSVEETTSNAEISLQLEENTPNPASTETTIQFTLTGESRVKVAIFREDGSLVRTVVDRMMSAGRASLIVDVSTLPSGEYFYVVAAGGVRRSKMLTVKH